jgi:hypothetical protein
MARNNGCAFGQVTRQMVLDIKEDTSCIRDKVGDMEKNLSAKMDDLYNHQSSRLPIWATILFTVGGSLIVGLIVWAVSK